MADFREREPNTPVEAELVTVQRRFDELGKIAWQAVVNDQDIDSGIATEQQSLKDNATKLFADVGIEPGTSSTFIARYFYDDEDKQQLLGKKIQYPLDYMYFNAQIEGRFDDVRSYPVLHPSSSRNPDNSNIGFRLCANVAATQVIGLRVPEENAVSVFLPIGEIYLNGYVEAERARREAESFQPAD